MRRDLSTIDRNIGQMWSRLIQEASADGITNDMIYGGLVTGQTVLQPLNVAQTTQNCLVPTRRVTWEGRVFKYGRATAPVGQTSFGLKFWYELSADGVVYNTTVVAQAVNTSAISFIPVAGEAFLANALVGGYVILHTHTVKHDMVRRIVSNTAVDDTGTETITITVDVPWPIAIDAAYDVEVLPNPYMGLRQRAAGGDAGAAGCHYSSVAGMPQVKSTVADSFHWIQTWGPCWVNPLTPLGTEKLTDRRIVFFDYEGAITKVGPIATTSFMQIAGFIINAEQTAVGPPLIMLQISP
ncbi:hypothetical protein ES708_30212 [subsurface metagenome]